ncbi:MAG: helix-turn-helix transcriptional regulator [Lachnospiraceae bacterium]
MNSVERVKKLCKDRNIPISRLERDLGYSNGYIGQLRKGVFPYERIAAISKYLNISIEYLMTGQEKEEEPYYLNEETAKLAQDMFEDPDMRALFDMKRNMPPERFKTHMEFMKNLYKQEKGER